MASHRSLTGVLLLVGGYVFAGCEGDYRKELDDEFPTGMATAGEPEGSFRAAMASFHVAPRDIDCMWERVRSTTPIDSTPDRMHEISFTAEELTELAAECEIDISELWYMTD